VKKKLYLSLVIVALLCLVGWTGHGREQRTSAGRQTWEYRIDADSKTASATTGEKLIQWDWYGSDDEELIIVGVANMV
jgi:hypothetical protein